MPLKNEAITCRAFGHAWDEIPTTRRPNFGVYIWLRCIHCGTVREDTLSPHSGQLLQRRYNHSESFKMTRGPRRARQEFRAEYLAAARLAFKRREREKKKKLEKTA